jgi:NAD(P)-dependent dehydrogenase (short-subunit alcohol dehydrogenase family)
VPERGLPGADEPSRAGLLFLNLSGDLEQEYFADAIAEDIITAVSRISLAVGYRPNVCRREAVGRELRVRYVLEGSSRKAGNRIRVTAQLAMSGQYGAAKAALIFDTERWALEFVPHGIRVNTVSPGSILVEGNGWDRYRRANPGRGASGPAPLALPSTVCLAKRGGRRNRRPYERHG